MAAKRRKEGKSAKDWSVLRLLRLFAARVLPEKQ
jgi:hypothetical protein